MDSFKTSEVERMEKGGNGKWKDFWEGHKASEGGAKWSFPGKGGDEAAKRKIEATYGGEVGEEYKERLSCLVEGREFTGVPKPEKKKSGNALEPTISGSSSSLAGLASTGGGAGGGGAGPKTQKQQNEDFFSRKGSENANRPDNLRPSEGGKYAGFGSAPADPQSGGSGGVGGGAMPGVDDFQKDPLAAVSKGWGWFSSQATKVGKGVYEGGVFAGQKVRIRPLHS